MGLLLLWMQCIRAGTNRLSQCTCNYSSYECNQDKRIFVQSVVQLTEASWVGIGSLSFSASIPTLTSTLPYKYQNADYAQLRAMLHCASGLILMLRCYWTRTERVEHVGCSCLERLPPRRLTAACVGRVEHACITHAQQRSSAYYWMQYFGLYIEF